MPVTQHYRQIKKPSRFNRLLRKPKPAKIICVRCGLISDEQEWKTLPASSCSHFFADPKDRFVAGAVRTADQRS